MTRAEYIIAEWRTRFCCVLVACLLLPLLFVCGKFAVTHLIHIPTPAERSLHKPDGWDGALAGIKIGLILAPLLGLYMLALFYLSRLIGRRCPSCNRCVTGLRQFEKIVESGQCPFCKKPIF